MSHSGWSDELTSAQMHEDIDFLVKTILDSHPEPYAYVSRDDFRAAVEQTKRASAENMPLERFYFHAAWLAGQIRNGHTQIHEPGPWNGYDGKVFPLYWKLDEDRVRLYAGHNLDKRYWGATVHEINGDTALEVIRRYSMLKPREARDFNPDIGWYSSFLWRCTALDYGEGDLELKLEKLNGKVEHVTIEAVPIDQVRTGLAAQVSGQQSPITFRYCENCQTGIMRIAGFRDEFRFREGLKNAFSELKTNNAENLIIDVRGCPGGSSRFAVELVKYLTDAEFRTFQKYRTRYSRLYQQQRGRHAFLVFTGSIMDFRGKPIKPGANDLRFTGNLYVLINGRTASTAVDFAGIVKYYKLGKLIGVETGDTMATYGDNLRFRLPNSGFLGTVSCKYFEMPGMTRENARKGVQPDYHVAPLLEDMWNSRDRIMEFAKELCSCDQ